jgi:uncharacterized protein YbaR (Trm112 family)
MPLTPDDLRFLACPICHQPLTLEADPALATIQCSGCARVYPIADGIPILLTDRVLNRDR